MEMEIGIDGTLEQEDAKKGLPPWLQKKNDPDKDGDDDSKGSKNDKDKMADKKSKAHLEFARKVTGST